MTFYVQYNETGDIVATVQSFNDKKPPIHPRQLVFKDYTNLRNKRVNLETKELEDIPPPPKPEPIIEEVLPEPTILDKIIEGIIG